MEELTSYFLLLICIAEMESRKQSYSMKFK
jgi:hypothetical protein